MCRILSQPPVLRLLFMVLLVCSGIACSTRRPDFFKTRATHNANIGYALARAEAAWRALDAGAKPETERKHLAAYATAMADLVEALQSTGTLGQPGDYTLPDATICRLEPAPADARRHRDPASYDRLTPIRRPRENRVVPHATAPGLGIPILAKVRTVIRDGRIAPGTPENGQFSPLTAWVDFTRHGQARRAVLHFSDPREIRSITIGRRSYQLARDLATVVHARFDEQNFLHAAMRGLLRPEFLFAKRGVYLSGAYAPDKVPVILTHGLMSDPAIWENIALSILADPQLGQHFQVWYYFYPTGVAVPFNASAFRDNLAAIRRFYDPEGDDIATRNTVFIGHSMGGILSRMMVIDSGEDFRAAYFTKPLSALRMSDEMRALVKKTLYFQSTSGARRAIFIAAPHRGSSLADNFLARLGTWLVRLPERTLRTTFNIATFNSDTLNPALWGFRNLGATSIDTLNPRHPYFTALAARPIRVPYHSIIGDRGRRDGPNSSDGFVPYWSSHIPGAASETFVPHGHSCVEAPETVSEVTRILLRSRLPQR